MMPINSRGSISVAKANPAKIFKRAWPDVILAKSRTGKLIIRERLEINSIIIINGVIAKGDPFGKKWLNIKIRLLKKADNHNVNITFNAKKNVRSNWAVRVPV